MEIDARDKDAEPLYTRANKTLNAILDELHSHLADIDGRMKELSEERQSLAETLNRIAPSTPTPIMGYATAGSPIGEKRGNW